MTNIEAKASGKVILSGEHSVVYNKPALAVPFSKSVFCNISETNSSDIKVKLTDFESERVFNLNDIINSDGSLLDEFSLPLYILNMFYKKYNIKFEGVEITVKSNLPISVGLGSSAAFIMSWVKGLNQYYELNLSDKEMFEVGLDAENLVHLKSSGIDIAVALYGKPIKYIKGTDIESLQESEAKLYLINTGKAESLTADCVKHVKKFADDDVVWGKFNDVTLSIEKALLSNDSEALKQGIKNNHKLLCDIEVVPNKVKKFIEEVESMGGAAKISGAGSVAGDNAGIVLAYIEDDKEPLKQLAEQYNYDFIG